MTTQATEDGGRRRRPALRWIHSVKRKGGGGEGGREEVKRGREREGWREGRREGGG